MIAEGQREREREREKPQQTVAAYYPAFFEGKKSALDGQIRQIDMVNIFSKTLEGIFSVPWISRTADTGCVGF